MNFKVAGSANSRDYIAAGKAGAAGARNAFIAARKSAPDYGGIGETALNTRSKERQAATKAEADVAKTGLAAMEYTKRAQIKADTEKELAKKKAGATRMAGIVGGLGAIAGGAFMGIEAKREKAAQAARDAQEEARWQQRLDAIKEHNKRPGYESPDLMELPSSVEDMQENPDKYTIPEPEVGTVTVQVDQPQPSPSEADPSQVIGPTAQKLSSTDSGVQKLAAATDKARSTRIVSANSIPPLVTAE